MAMLTRTPSTSTMMDEFSNINRHFPFAQYDLSDSQLAVELHQGCLIMPTEGNIDTDGVSLELPIKLINPQRNTSDRTDHRVMSIGIIIPSSLRTRPSSLLTNIWGVGGFVAGGGGRGGSGGGGVGADNSNEKSPEITAVTTTTTNTTTTTTAQIHPELNNNNNLIGNLDVTRIIIPSRRSIIPIIEEESTASSIPINERATLSTYWAAIIRIVNTHTGTETNSQQIIKNLNAKLRTYENSQSISGASALATSSDNRQQKKPSINNSNL
eukprot:gene12989-27413_t